MKLVIDTRELKQLRDKGVSSWEMFVLLFLEETVEDSDWSPLPITTMEKALGLDRTQQTRILHGLTRHGYIETRVRGVGKARRQVRLIRSVTGR